MKNYAKKYYLVVLLLILSLPVIYSLFHPGFFKSDDGEWMIIRSSAFYQAFTDGQIPTRFLHRLDFGYGYPVSNFVYPGFLYLSVPLQLIGFGSVDSIKIILIISLIGSIVFCFYWLSLLFNKKSAFLGSLFYLYAPYHLSDVYKRGSVGEVLALCVIPFIMFMVEKKNLFFFSMGIFLLIISHNILAFLFLPLIFIYTLIRKTFSYKELFLGFLFGVLMSSFFTIPALIELKYTVFNQTKISDFSKYYSSFELIGLLAFFIAIISFLLIINKVMKRGVKDSMLEIFFLLVCLVSLFLSSSISGIIWAISPSGLIQFPFRFLSLSILSSAFLLTFLFQQIEDKKVQKIIFALLLILIIITSLPYLRPSEFINKGEGYYLTNEASTTVSDEYTPKWVKEKPLSHFNDKVEVINGRATIESLIYDNKNISFKLNASTDSKIRINIIYYPGFKLRIDKAENKIDYSNQKGVIEFAVSKGLHVIEYSYGETPLRLIADLISLMSFIALALYSFRKINLTKRI